MSRRPRPPPQTPWGEPRALVSRRPSGAKRKVPSSTSARDNNKSLRDQHGTIALKDSAISALSAHFSRMCTICFPSSSETLLGLTMYSKFTASSNSTKCSSNYIIVVRGLRVLVEPFRQFTVSLSGVGNGPLKCQLEEL